MGFLGLRLVKLTVNFDDPETYHLYYGDGVGHPGTIMTFFPWPGGDAGRKGTGQLTTTSFSIPESALDFWIKRFRDRHVSFEGPTRRHDDERVLSFSDPDGLSLEIVAHPKASEQGGWAEGPIAPENAIRGFHVVTLTEEGYESTAAMLTKDLGFRLASEDGNCFRYEVGAGGPGAMVDVMCRPAAPRGVVNVGTVHHVAWRTPSDREQKSWRDTLVKSGRNVTPIIDRRYFHSIYFREPGGVLFEIATDPPGFTIDEPESELGKSLKLPSWLEPLRQHLEHTLPSVHLPRITRD
jgi:glyoxalase family protein